MKQVILVHGYKGKPNTNWKPWLKNELEQIGFTVKVPEMPHTNNPVAEKWAQTLNESISEANIDTYIIGHSLGCITILRYLEALPQNVKIGGCIFVAGFTNKFKNYNGGFDSFFDHELDWEKIKSHCDNFTAIQSSDDKIVEIEQLGNFKKELNAVTVQVNGMGHFSTADGASEAPLVLNKFKDLLNR